MAFTGMDELIAETQEIDRIVKESETIVDKVLYIVDLVDQSIKNLFEASSGEFILKLKEIGDDFIKLCKDLIDAFRMIFQSIKDAMTKLKQRDSAGAGSLGAAGII